MNDVLCVGNVYANLLFAQIPQLPTLGEMLRVASYDVDIGGGAAITAIGLARLGMKVTLSTRCGSDLLGTMIYQKLQADNVGLNCFRQVNSIPTSVAVELSVGDQRATVVAESAFDEPGALPETTDHISKVRHVHLKHLHLERFKLLKLARVHGASTSVDANLLDPYQRELLKRARGLIDLLLINEREAKALTQTPTVEEAICAAGKYAMEHVIVTLGKDGVLYQNGSRLVQSPALGHLKGDVVGAGDSFNAGFLFGYLNGKSVTDCVLFGSVLAAFNIQRPGGTRSLPNPREFESFLEARGHNQ